MDPNDIANCHFVPLSALENAMEFARTGPEHYNQNSNCEKRLSTLQTHTTGMHTNWNTRLTFFFHKAIHRAIYNHDWNKLLYLLKKSPIWNHTTRAHNGTTLYIRALTILFMYHPTAQAEKLLDSYMHLACTCRKDEEKKALMKLILMLPEKFIERYLYLYQTKHKKYRQDNY